MTLLTACESLRLCEPETQSLADLLDVREVCRFLGGTRPLNPATLYRGISMTTRSPAKKYEFHLSLIFR